VKGVPPEGTPQRLYPHSPVLSKNDGWPTTKSIATLASAMQEGGTDQVDAMQRSDARMTANDAATRAVIQNGTNLQRGRASLIALWLMQVALAVMFLMAGGSKLAGVPAMVSLFDGIGLGQWFRYMTGAIELISGIALLVPSAAVFGAMLLIPTMFGAIVTNVFVVPASPVPPLLLLLGAAAVAWARLHQLRIS
jgi:putative oxidoreductase